MKNPNGYGTVTTLSGNRRRPYIVKEGHSGKQRPIGYAATREEGLILLAQYNKQPWNLDTEKMTFRELYDMWTEKRAVKLNEAARLSLRSAYQHCTVLDKRQYKNIRTWQMQECIDACGRGYASQGAIKNLFRHLDRFAMELDIIDRSRASLLTSAPIPETSRTVFSEEELRQLWDMYADDIPFADCALFLLYTGFRISEMMNMSCDSIDLDKELLCGGVKTAAGRNRIVPIHPRIRPIVVRRLEQSVSGKLFEYNGKPLSKTTMHRLWDNLMMTAAMQHTPHECRHTFRSRLDSAGANKVCIDRLMGHVSHGTGERVYTHKTIAELQENLLLLRD